MKTDIFKLVELQNEHQNDLFSVRFYKLKKLQINGYNPFVKNWSQYQLIEEIKCEFNSIMTKNKLLLISSISGRIISLRSMGTVSFFDVQDQSGRLQVYIDKNKIKKSHYNLFKYCDVGDIVGVKGYIFKTKTSEITIKAKIFNIISKSLRPLPSKWHGFKGIEGVNRQKYLDLIVNQKSREIIITRSCMLTEIRKLLWLNKYLEVETPCFHNIAGGASARPFVIKMNALNCNFFLRISLELHLKRMIIGGIDKVFEIGRVFRNEGLSRKHSPEFTMLELYKSYSDYKDMMKVIYNIIQHLCINVIKRNMVINRNGIRIKLNGSWREVEYRKLIFETTNDCRWFDRSKYEKLSWCRHNDIIINSELKDHEITNKIFEKIVEPKLIQPTFVIHLPKELCPLAKTHTDDQYLNDVFELCIDGQEIAPAYSEQNDPVEQKNILLNQAGNDIFKTDNDFIFAIEHGMPPAGGMGVGIDRLCCILTESESIRDTILFPIMKPV